MLKALGAVMVIGSCSAIGFTIKKSLLDRKCALKSFLSAFELIKSELVFRNRDIPSVVELVCEYCGGASAMFFKAVKTEGYDIRRCFEKNAFMLRSAGLSRDDINEIKEGVLSMGRFDSTVQAERLEKTINRLEALYDNAVKEGVDNGSLYTSLGISAGILLAVILI